jgi:hypothetical protein
MSRVISLPRGLAVLKERRNELRGVPQGAVPVGKRPWEVYPGEYYPDWRMKITKVGLPGVKRSCETEDFAEACRFAREVFDRLMKGVRVGVLQELDRVLKGGVVVEAGGTERVRTAGDYFSAFLKVMRKDSHRRAVQSTRLMVALARGWVVRSDRDSRAESIREGSELARRIDGLPAGEVWSTGTLKGYFAARQGGQYDPTGSGRGHLAYNKTVHFARDMWRSRPRALCYEGMPLPPGLEGWMGFPLLKEDAIDPREGAISPEGFRAMVEWAEGCRGSEAPEVRALGVANLLFRVLGLRTKELVCLRAGWLWRDPKGGRWYVDIKDRPEEGFAIKGSEAGQVPVSEEVRGLLEGVLREHGPQGWVVWPEGSAGERLALLERVHNERIKECIGEVHNRQGNHRLRKLVATYLGERYGDEVAGTYLRHSDAGKGAGTFRRHYRMSGAMGMDPRFAGLPVVEDADLRAWAGGECTAEGAEER